MPRPHSLSSKSPNELSQLAMLNLHILEPRIRPEFHSHIRSLENLVCEFEARLQEQEKELSEGWVGKIREGWPKIPVR